MLPYKRADRLKDDRPQPSDAFSDRPTSATAIALLGLQHCARTDDKEQL
jgi:hypothetical protein